MTHLDDVKSKTRKSYAESAKAMLEYVENSKTFLTDKIITLPTSIFTDADRWKKEMSEIFEKLPLCLATTAELREIGDYKAADMLGKPILMMRGKDSKVRAFLNVCSHRGAPVVAEGCGRVRRMSCKYHGWTYDLDGKLIGVADAHTFGDIDKSAKGLKELPCEEKNGLIFVCLTPGQTFNLDGFSKAFLMILRSLDSLTGIFSVAECLQGRIGKLPLTVIWKPIILQLYTPKQLRHEHLQILLIIRLLAHICGLGSHKLISASI